MIVKIGIMSEGDQVLNCWDDKIAIRRANGDVDIFQIRLENNVPTLSQDVWRITHGNNTVKLEVSGKADDSAAATASQRPIPVHVGPPTESHDDADFEISIRPRKG